MSSFIIVGKKCIYLITVCLQLIMNAVTLFYIRILKITQLKGKKKHALFLPFVENKQPSIFLSFRRLQPTLYFIRQLFLGLISQKSELSQKHTRL
jgi:hypothetical protein